MSVKTLLCECFLLKLLGINISLELSRQVGLLPLLPGDLACGGRKVTRRFLVCSTALWDRRGVQAKWVRKP